MITNFKIFENVTQPYPGEIKYNFEKLNVHDFVLAYRPKRPSDNNNMENLINDIIMVLDVGEIEWVDSLYTTYSIKFSNGAIYFKSPKDIEFASDRKKICIDHLKMLKKSKEFNL